MRRIVIWFASTVTIVILVFGYHTSTNRNTTGLGVTNPAAQSGPTAGTSGGTSSGSKKTSGSSAASSSTKTVTGGVAQTEWGPVQVQLSVKAKRITAVKVVQQPNGNSRDFEINSYALPILIQETMSKQSAQIDMVSGATITSGGYIQSLQSALDQAGI
jgi:uncharacterized protein with FMN-binding domain